MRTSYLACAAALMALMYVSRLNSGKATESKSKSFE